MLLYQIMYLYMEKCKRVIQKQFKISVPNWNNKFGLPDGPYSTLDIQDYLQYIIK